MNVSVLTNVGKVRSNNEDAYVCIPPWHRYALSKNMCVFAVADGMGGHENGEVASGMAVQLLEAWFSSFKFDSVSPVDLANQFIEINSAIHQFSLKNPNHKNMGTTLSAVLITKNTAYVAHVGDSRAYLLRDGELRQVTNDHSLISQHVQIGKMSLEDSKKHSLRHMLTRALGVREFIDVDLIQLDLKKNDVILLCSDGIHRMISDNTIKAILQTVPFQKVANNLVSAANNAGGLDNSTAIAVQLTSVPVFYPSFFSWYRFKKMIFDW